MKFATYDDGSIDGRLFVVSGDRYSRRRRLGDRPEPARRASTLARGRSAPEASLRGPRRQPGAERRRVRAEALPCAVASRATMVRRLGLSQSWPTDGPRFQQAADSGLRHDPGHVSGRERRLSGTLRRRPVRQRGGRDRLRGRVRRDRRRGSDGGDRPGRCGKIRLIVQINDWSLRAIGAYEMPRGFGFLQAKPSTSFAPIAVTPEELGPPGATAAWR